MTTLLLQLLNVLDAETSMFQGYFDWGRGWAASSKEADWGSASPAERLTIARRGYSLYDGWPAIPDNFVGPMEAYVSTGINSRVILYDVIRFLVHRDEAAPLLELIPEDLPLEDGTRKQITAAAALIDLFDREPQIGVAKATKMLYKKRPHFIPVLDSAVSDFLWKNCPFRITQSSPTVEVLQLYQDLLRARYEPLQTIQTALAGQGFDLSLARILSFLVWLEWNPRMGSNGFGPSLNQVWNTHSPSAAREKARSLWDSQNRSAR